ncbi:MAG: YkgJ family cysteine cluster protein [Saprospiraceae bacterium]|nr:YkgJ family cysteine cluster protein [Bacteroidia bacterium]NNE14276.1 YkgJ family cysteine cluster protein [Saprospiraceae bacterium]NNL92969.1 YkgJ family cysteine cluster protein [Saprospiraceae bacterium]
MEDKLSFIKEQSANKKSENKKFFRKLKQRPPKNLDGTMIKLHEEVFANTDCLTCANCCKTTGPLFTDKDIDRLSKHLKVRPSAFIETYLKMDEEGDYVLQQVPCAFLGVDNYCSVYDHRPKACKEFPHTDRRKFEQIGNLTMKNVAICPAAYDVVEKLKSVIKF